MEGTSDKFTELTTLVEELTTGGGKVLNEKKLKELKKLCRVSDELVQLAYRLIFHHLSQPHCEIRLLAFFLIKELFQRSHVFRECLVADFQLLLELILETEPSKPLPPPLPIAKLLKQDALKTIHEWHGKFGAGYRKLELGYQYLRRCKRVDFHDMEARTRIEREREEERNRRLEIQRSEKLEKLTEEIKSMEQDAQNLVLQMNNCFQLLIPRPEDFLGEPKADWTEPVDLRSHGLVSFHQVVEVNLKPDPVQVDKDNVIIVQTLREQYSLLKNRFLPMVNRWNSAVTKLNSAVTLRKILDMKSEFKHLESKYLELKLPGVPLKDYSDSDSDFEDVTEKEGFEETAQPSDVFPFISASPSRSKLEQLDSAPSSDPVPSTSCSKMANFLGSVNRNETSGMSETKRKLLAIAPKLPFHADLITWGQEPQDAPIIARPHGDGHRFWSASSNDQEGVAHPEGRAARLTRVTEFTGQFEPISWFCRAPLPSGKLCPRQDRRKCPFHGKIVPRNEIGELTDPNQPPESSTNGSAKNSVPDWQDPQLLAELQAATGVDLTVGKKSRKGKNIKHPNLTDLKAKQNTVRKRLEKKVFNKATVQRVSAVLDGLDHRKHSDKFGDQFNYSLNK